MGFVASRELQEDGCGLAGAGKLGFALCTAFRESGWTWGLCNPGKTPPWTENLNIKKMLSLPSENLTQAGPLIFTLPGTRLLTQGN